MHTSYKLLSGISETTGVPVESTSIAMTADVITGHSVVYRHAGLKMRPVTAENLGKNQ